VIVDDDEVGDATRRSGRVGPERDTDVGQANRLRIVRAVAGHRDDAAQSLERLHDADLVRGRDACEHRRVTHYRIELVVVQLVDLGAGDDAPVDEPELGPDGRRRLRVVARQHDDGDPGVLQPADRSRGGGAGDVGDGDEAEELEVVDAAVVDVVTRGSRAFGHGEHA
jgi:hypothetical protein